MPNERDQVLNLVQRAEVAVLRQENALVREILAAYSGARRDLLATFMEQVAALGADPSAADVRRLATSLQLIRAIERRLEQLEREVAEELAEGLGGIARDSFERAAAETSIFASALGVNVLPLAVDPLLELTIGPAIDQVPGLIGSLRANVLAELRQGLASGDRMGDIARAVFGDSNSTVTRSATSAELLTRRAVIQAENNARMLFYEHAQANGLPALRRQAVAKIGGDTTRTCLRLHGQIRDLDEPFEVVGEPSFGRRQMQPPFHWRCRTRVVAYHPAFEETSTLSTADMESAARQELASR